MKKIIFPLAITLIAATTIFIGCESPASKVDNAQQNVTDAQANVVDAQAKLVQAKKDSAAEYEQAKVEWAGRLAQDEKDIADYKVLIAKEKKDAKKTDEARLDKLQKREDDLKTSMAEYKQDGNESWANFKTRVDKAADEFGNDLSDLGKSLKKDFTPKSKQKS